ncbi:MAG: SPOR domain-containing protein, partial [Nitrospinae bacterium]|nr:SPOR domain-containing protein [Nitrospinota bacterium]
MNLLEGDDEEREGDSEGDSGDDGGSYERRRGGFVDVLMVILFVCVMLGGVAWAGYQFWWLPKVKKEAQLERARKKQEQQRRMPVANRQGATERAQRAPGGFSQTASAQAQQRAMSATARNTRHERSAPSRPAETPAPPAAPMAKRMPATPGPAGSAPSAAVTRMEKPAPSPARAEKKPLAASATMQKPVSPPNVEARPRRDATPAAQPPRKAEPRKRLAEKKPKKPAPRVRSGAAARKSPRGFYYSVQVASCSTERCANSFSRRLRSKGFSAFRVASTSRTRRRSGQITEVRLGSFSSLAEARTLMNRVRKKKIEARVYRSDNQWRVAAGSFRNLEDAALLL